MSYGVGDYGQRGYGGSYLEEGGIILVITDPLDSAKGVPVDAPVSFTIRSPAGIDRLRLSVTIDGVFAILGGVCLAPFSGTVLQDPETTISVVISSHPPFEGETLVTVTATDLSGTTRSPFFRFFETNAVDLSETVSYTEELTTHVGLHTDLAEGLLIHEALVLARKYDVVVEDSVTIHEELCVGTITVEAVDGSTIEIYCNTELSFDNIGYLDNYLLEPVGGGARVYVSTATPGYEVKAEGSTLEVVDLDMAFSSGVDIRGKRGDFSNILDFHGGAVFDPGLHLGDYIEILNGNSVGRYQIIGFYTTNIGARPRILLDSPLSLKDPANGAIDGMVEIVDASTNTFRVPSVTVADPIIEVLLTYNKATGDSFDLGKALEVPGRVTLLDHNTFRLNPDPGFIFTTSDSDPVFARVRISSKLEWVHTSGVQVITLRTKTTGPAVGTKLTQELDYRISAQHLKIKVTKAPAVLNSVFSVSSALVQKPKVVSATFLPSEGRVLVAFDQDMRIDDSNFGNPGDYFIAGPSAIAVNRVYTTSPSVVLLETLGEFTAGVYTLTVSVATPKDVAGNPTDPVFNSAIFTAAIPEITRSIFTDRGPIARPPLTIQFGVAGVLEDYNEVTLTGAVLTSTNIGQYVQLSGSPTNGGVFKIAVVLTTTRVRLDNASFTLPDLSALVWEVFDPRDGQLADDPADVSVRINGLPVVPEAVVGLLGQIVLLAAPSPTDDVKVDYSWVQNPVIEVRRLNSKEFRLNAWNRDIGYKETKSQHKYRYNNVLVTPSDYEPDDPQATLAQPLNREEHYRAYERAYTPALNDASNFLLNSPQHKIAFPKTERSLFEEFVAYEALVLPEAASAPWTRHGTGTVSVSGGHLKVVDTQAGPYPVGSAIFWTRLVDFTFPHVLSVAWRGYIETVTTSEGVFTGVAAGFSDEKLALVVGYLEDGGVKKLGVLKRGFGDDPSSIMAWIGVIDIDWTVLHSYRVFRDASNNIHVYLDGSVTPSISLIYEELPYLEELSGPFEELQGIFFGAMSRAASLVCYWDFVRYLVQPTRVKQLASSSFVSYEANGVPELDPKPWTPVGFHGTETIISADYLLLDATSATDTATADDVGLVDGDFRGFVRIEPLLTVSSEFVLDARLQLLTRTHGVSPYGTMLAVDDGTRLMQLAFLADAPAPKISYGGRSLPTAFAPFVWGSVGGQQGEMVGRTLRISDSSVTDGLVYYYDDTEPVISMDRVVSLVTDYILEFRCKVLSYTTDGGGFAGVFGHVFDSVRALGLLFEDNGLTRYVSFHSDGVVLAQFAFNWNDDSFHTYRLSKSSAGNLVSLFIDGAFIGSLAYSSFLTPAPTPQGQISFGSATPASSGSLSVVDWAYCNAWRVNVSRRYVGLWKGTDPSSLLGYHLPLKASGRGAQAIGNVLKDPTVDFIAAGVAPLDYLLVDSGPNTGIYRVTAVVSPTQLTISSMWPVQPSVVSYRIVKETDWSVEHKYRLTRDSSGEVSLLLDADTAPLIRVEYSPLDLPESGLGIVKTLSGGLPAIVFGAFDAENLAQSSWDYVRYGIIRSPTELGIVPHHQVLNQWNVMSSPERLFTILAHDLTIFKSSSTGIVPKKDPDFLADSGLVAFTQLNENTPLMPRTQTFEVRKPFPIQELVSGLNRPEDVLNNDGDFVLNDSTKRFKLIVPDDVLYSALDIIEQSTGEVDLIAPADDVHYTGLTLDYNKQVCLTYDGAVLPEDDSSAPTPWALVSDIPAFVINSAFAGILTYGTAGVTRTVYRNNTPLPDSAGLRTEVNFRLKVVSDTSGGVGDTRIKFGLSAPNMTLAFSLLTLPSGKRLVVVLDQNNGKVLGSASLDYLDGNYHTYRIIRDPGANMAQVLVY